MADGNNDRKSGDAKPGWQVGAGMLLERLKSSGFAHRAAEFAKNEVDRMVGSSVLSSRKMSYMRAQELSGILNQMLANLIVECKEEQRKLKSGGILGLRGRELSAHDVDIAVAALIALAYHFDCEMMDFIRLARQGGSVIASQFLPPDSPDPSQPARPRTMLATGIGSQGMVTSLSLPPERLRLIAEQLRGLHEYAIRFATDIQEDIAGSHGASPSAHEKALNKSIMLTQRLDAVATQILQLLDPNADVKAVLSGNAIAHALPPVRSSGQ
jgi:hypothetical protein